MEADEKKEQEPNRILCGKSGKHGMPSADDLIQFYERLTGKKATPEEIAKVRETYRY